MKKLALISILAFALIFSTFSVFAAGDQSILSKVTGLSDDEITELQAQGIGYGQLIPASVLAERLDMDISNILALRQAGKTYYEIATDKGIKADDYQNDLLEKKNSYVDEQVKAGIITESQGKLIKERMSTNIGTYSGLTSGLGRFNGGCGMGGGFGGFGMGGGFGGFGMGGGFGGFGRNLR